METNKDQTGGSKILVIEDDQKIRELLVEGLAGQGYSISAADNGLEALQIIETFQPNLCIVDLNMPKLDGMAFLQALRNRPETKTVPSIVLTAQSDDTNINKAMDLGARHFLVKPIRFKLFLNYVRSCLNE
jgi:CheY-like chemotaxis protein